MNSNPNLVQLRHDAAEALAAILAPVAVGARVAIDPYSDLCVILEYLIPALLRQKNPEWERESIDGFYISAATKTGEMSAEVSGTCIIISDQCVTPFEFGFELSGGDEFETIRIRLGERGGGSLGISGPICTSKAAQELLLTLNSRIDSIEWVYSLST